MSEDSAAISIEIMQYAAENTKDSEDAAEHDVFKCGEVYLRLQKNELNFYCSVCHKSLKNFDEFKVHLYHCLDLYEEFHETTEETEHKVVMKDEDCGEEANEEEHNRLEDYLGKEELDIEEEEYLSDTSLLTEIYLETNSEQDEPVALTTNESTDKKGKATNQTPLECPQCNKVFNRKANLRIHSFTHAPEKPYSCDECDTTFASKSNLVVHKRRHTGERPFECDFCTSRFFTTSELKIHSRIHSGERPYVCEECGSAFVTAGKLLDHRKSIHMDSREFKCPICDKAFRSNYKERNHFEKVHGNLPRDKECNICKATFKTNVALKTHMDLHLKKKKYKCMLCEKEFAQQPGLYSHMKTHKVVKENKWRS